MLTLQYLLEEMIQRDASDLHLTAGVPPQLRIDGDLVPTDHESLTAEQCQDLIYSALREEQRKRFELNRELDLSFGIQDLSRFRVNVFLQRGVVAAAIRRIPYLVPTLEALGLPAIVSTFADFPQGLVLVTGPTGSGKTTTLAALIDRINQKRMGHIITVEDPIEYIHQHRRCIVNQREVNADTDSFPGALKYILRQDPDVILVGEMRDLETMAAALTIAETGHLVFATLHTNSTYESVNRIVDVFPTNQQRQVLSQLAFVLKAVVTQQLLPNRSGKGRINVSEILITTPAVSAVIREHKIHQIYTLMQAGQKFGMQTMNLALFEAVEKRKIAMETAFARSPNPQELEQLFSRSGLRTGAAMRKPNTRVA